MERSPGGQGGIPPLSALLRNEEEFGADALLKAPRCVKTGFSALDRLLGGGLSPGLTVLGASPGLGKSTLALNIAEQVSAQGSPVRYYSYEMPPKRLGMKLIVRQNFRSGGSPLFSAKDLFDAETLGTWTDAWEAYRQARRQVAERIGGLYIVDCDAGGRAYTAEDIQADVKRFMEEQNPEGKMPLLIVDYLQILPLGETVRISDIRQAVDYNIRKMTALSKSYGGIPVLLISSLGRTSYKVPVQIDSFKESGSIEFSADTLLGIQFSACQREDGSVNKDWSMDREKDRMPREMDLVVLKQRYGETGRIPFLYYAAYDCFAEASAPLALPERPAAGQSGLQAHVPDRAAPPEAEADPAVQREPSAAPEPEEAQDKNAGREEQNRPRAQNREKACINNTMIAHDLRRGAAVPGEEQRCRVLPARDIYTAYTISAPLSYDDCDVADGLYSLFLTEKYFSPEDGFTLRRLLTMLTGDSRQTLTAQKREALAASIARLRETRITIRCGQELEARSKDRRYRKVNFEEPRSFLRLSESGEKFYFPSAELAEVLPLYAYAAMTGQVISFPTALLRVRGEEGGRALGNTAEMIAVKHFLIYRLEVVRNKKSALEQHAMRTVAFGRDSQLLHILRLRREDYSSADWARRCRRINGMVRMTLDHFRRIGYISGYTVNDENSVTVTGPVADPWTLGFDL